MEDDRPTLMINLFVIFDKMRIKRLLPADLIRAKKKMKNNLTLSRLLRIY